MLVKEKMFANSKNEWHLNNKAFTLIELLSIIVILAMIAVITVPIILNVIDNSKKGAIQDSALGFKDSVQKYYMNTLVDDKTVELPNGYVIVGSLPSDFTVNGDIPTNDSWLQLEKGQVVAYSLKFGDYVVTKYKDSEVVCEKGEVQENEETRAARLKLEAQTQAAAEVASYISSLLADSTIQGYTENTSKKVSEISTPVAPTGVDGDSWVYFEKGVSSVSAPDYSIKITKGDYTFVVNCVGGKVSTPEENGTLLEQKIPPSFANDDWATIKANLIANRNAYKVGSEKIVNINLEGTSKDYKLRLANIESCSNNWEGSKTACGVVIEFVTTIGTHNMNGTSTNAGGWEASGMRSYLNSGNDSIYSKLNAVIGKDSSNNDIIISTSPVISGAGYGNNTIGGGISENAEDYLYLLSTREVGFNVGSDKKNAATDTNILSYYNNNNASRIKYDQLTDGTAKAWWLRSAYSTEPSHFYYVSDVGNSSFRSAFNSYGVAPAFRILD